ncbi:hypothetical protein MMC20_000638 [Loxospora ochrophaea]|nr:hypothetical protein [Loxospora ochrophaea]
MLGPWGREFMGLAQIVFLIFVMGSHILTFSIMMNTVTSHGACTIIFGVIGTILSLILTLPRKLRAVSHMAIVSFISIFAAILITMIGVAVDRKGNLGTEATVQTSLHKGFLAVTNIIFAYAGHVAFFGFMSEMKFPHHYPKALYLLQAVDTTMYLIVAAVIYYYAGTDVASPALGSTSPLLRKIAYGVATPTIVIAGVINGHVASKYIYVRLFRGTNFLDRKDFLAYASWAAIATLLWSLAWAIAKAIPVFNNLLGLISALFSSWFTYGLSGVFWLFLNKGKYRKTWKKMALTAINVFIVFLGAVFVSDDSFFKTCSSSNFPVFFPSIMGVERRLTCSSAFLAYMHQENRLLRTPRIQTIQAAVSLVRIIHESIDVWLGRV